MTIFFLVPPKKIYFVCNHSRGRRNDCIVMIWPVALWAPMGRHVEVVEWMEFSRTEPHIPSSLWYFGGAFWVHAIFRFAPTSPCHKKWPSTSYTTCSSDWSINLSFCSRGLRLWAFVMGLLRKAWCTLLGLWWRSEKTFTNWQNRHCWISQCC